MLTWEKLKTTYHIMNEILDELSLDNLNDDYEYQIDDNPYRYHNYRDEDLLIDNSDSEDIDEDKLYEECDDVEEEKVEVEPKPKRGRKPKDRNYFDKEEEQAVIEYISYSRTISSLIKKILLLKFGWTEEYFDKLFIDNKDLQLYDLLEESKLVVLTDEDDKQKVSGWEVEIKYLTSKKDDIFNRKLKTPFKKMIEAIIRGMELYIPNEVFLDTYTDTLTHLISKADKFNPTKGKRAYSYYSNIIKNYLLGKREKYQKTLVRNPSYDELEMDFSNDVNYSTETDDKGKRVAEESIRQLTRRIKDMLDSPDDYALKDSEIKVGKALVTLFENWDYVLSTDNSNKLNKSVVLLFLREHTGLDTKGVRDNLKKFKKEFQVIKDFIVQ